MAADHTGAAAAAAAAMLGDAGATPLSRVARTIAAISEIARVSAAFLDPAGVLSDLDEHGALVPHEGKMQVLPSSMLGDAIVKHRPLLHPCPAGCAAVSAPFFVEGRLRGFVSAWGFCLAEPNERARAELESRMAVEAPGEVFGARGSWPVMEHSRLVALADLVEAAASEVTAYSEQARRARRSSGLPPWATSATFEVMSGGGPAELDEAVKARERLEAIYNSTRDAILMLDKDLKIVAANREFGHIFGTDPEAFIGVTGVWLRRWIIKNAKEPAHVSRQIDELLAKPGAILDDEIELLSPRQMILRFYSAPVLDKSSQVIGRVLMFRDITEFRKANKDLIGTEKMTALGRAAAGLAHEINNTLAAMLTYADYALEEGTNEKMREALRMSVAAAEKASQLVGEFLSVSGPAETLRQDVDLHLELERLLDSIEESYKRDNIRIHRLLEAVPRVSADPVQILKVFHHVLENARQAIGRDGTVTVRTETDWDRGTVRVIVSDSGPGIPPELIDRIFDPFFTTKGVVSGGDTAAKGLGLAVAKGIVEAHGGRIYAGNVLPHGASFVVELPLPGSPAEEPPSPSAY